MKEFCVKVLRQVGIILAVALVVLLLDRIFRVGDLFTLVSMGVILVAGVLWLIKSKSAGVVSEKEIGGLAIAGGGLITTVGAVLLLVILLCTLILVVGVGLIAAGAYVIYGKERLVAFKDKVQAEVGEVTGKVDAGKSKVQAVVARVKSWF